MKLLFDQNLSPRLTILLADIYAESVHVREVGLRDADDLAIWQYAKAHGYAIVSKDSDFNNEACSKAHRRNSSGCGLATVLRRELKSC